MSKEVVKTQTLFEIVEEIKTYENLIEEYASQNEGEISEDFDEIEKEFFGKLASKTDNYAKFIKSCETKALDFKEEKENFAKKQKAMENLATKAKSYIQNVLEYQDKKSLDGEKYKISLVGNGGKQPVSIFENVYQEKTYKEVLSLQIPNEYCKQIIVLDSEKVREDLESGKTLNFASLLPRGKSIRIK